ncbi:N-acetyltransferase [Salmonella enterica subsp. enterica]|nr:N-acetyltransferase [Salmonella enterica subsp. enterica]MIL09979.1 N-acetyltransferase [Salmonella enterica subsp. enterica serovar Enteritidis]
MAIEVRLEPAQESDFDQLVGLRMRSMRPSLEHINRFDPDRVRQRFRAEFRPAFTRLIYADAGALLGCVAMGPLAGDELWLQHFYLEPTASGRGVDSQVMSTLMAEADTARRVVLLDVLAESDAKRFYERFGFVETHRDAIDIYMKREPVA